MVKKRTKQNKLVSYYKALFFKGFENLLYNKHGVSPIPLLLEQGNLMEPFQCFLLLPFILPALRWDIACKFSLLKLLKSLPRQTQEGQITYIDSKQRRKKVSPKKNLKNLLFKFYFSWVSVWLLRSSSGKKGKNE